MNQQEEGRELKNVGGDTLGEEEGKSQKINLKVNKESMKSLDKGKKVMINMKEIQYLQKNFYMTFSEAYTSLKRKKGNLQNFLEEFLLIE